MLFLSLIKSFYSRLSVGLLALLLLAFRLPTAAQAPAWQSAQAVAAATAAVSNNSSAVTATAVDAAGNVYLAGNFRNTVLLGGTTLTSLGSADVFVAKFEPVSNPFVWAQRAGGAGFEDASALAVSGTSVYVAGYFDSATVGFGSTTLTNASGGTADLFVAKLTDAGPTGSFTWVQQAGSTGNDYARELAVSGTSVYVAGYFNSATVGFGSTTLTNAGVGTSDDLFVAKLTDAGSTGSFTWAQRAGGGGNERATALFLSGSRVYVAGSFDSPTAAFGTVTLSNPNRTFGTTLGFLAALADPTLTATIASAGPRASAALFPNPARRTVALRLPAGATPTLLTLTDARGRTVRRYSAPAGSEAALDLGGLPAGLYLLRGAGPAQRLAVE